jgi:hypothetical protein
MLAALAGREGRRAKYLDQGLVADDVSVSYAQRPRSGEHACPAAVPSETAQC